MNGIYLLFSTGRGCGMWRYVWPCVLAGILMCPAVGAEAAGETVPVSANEASVSSEEFGTDELRAFLTEATGRLEAGHGPLKTDANYVLLLDRSGEIGIDDGLFLVRDSVHVADVARESLTLSAEVLDVNRKGEVKPLIMDFRLDGDGNTFLKNDDGEFEPIPADGTGPSAVAAQVIHEKLADETVRQKILQEIEQLAIVKAGLADTEIKSDQDDKKKETTDTTAVPQTPVGDPEPEVKEPEIKETETKETVPAEPVSTPEPQHTVIEVVIAPDPGTMPEKEDVSDEPGDVVVSIETRKA